MGDLAERPRAEGLVLDMRSSECRPFRSAGWGASGCPCVSSLVLGVLLGIHGFGCSLGNDGEGAPAVGEGDQCSAPGSCTADSCCSEGSCLPAAECAAERCPGAWLPFTGGRLEVSPRLRPEDDLVTFCSPLGTPDLVYLVQAPTEGTLSVRPLAGATVQVRATETSADCTDGTKAVACATPSDPARVAVEREEALHLIVEGPELGSSEGAFELELSPGRCGDGAVNPTEECDDGNPTEGDGCSLVCEREAPAADTGSCPARDTLVHPGQDIEIEAHTVGYADHAPAACGGLRGGSDRHFSLTPDGVGQLVITVRPEFDAVLSAYQRCQGNQVTDLVRCSDGELPLAEEQIRIPVTSSEPVHVVVDGYHPRAYGRFQLHAELVQ